MSDAPGKQFCYTDEKTPAIASHSTECQRRSEDGELLERTTWVRSTIVVS